MRNTRAPRRLPRQTVARKPAKGEHAMRIEVAFPARMLLAAMFTLALALPALADVVPFPTSFRVQDIQTDGAVIHVRVGGSGPAVLMLHGFGDTGDMWAPLAARLLADHTVIVPDLRPLG